MAALKSCAFFQAPRRSFPVVSLDWTQEPHPRFPVQEGHILNIAGDALLYMCVCVSPFFFYCQIFNP
jgi:hypothetical protein